MMKSLQRLRGNNNGPSPVSVTAPVFDFPDDPYDVRFSTTKRASSVGHIQRMNGLHNLSYENTIRAPVRLPPSQPSQVSSSRLSSSFQMPPKSPGRSLNHQVKPPLSSPGNRSVSQKASNFRQRRLSLSRSRAVNTDSDSHRYNQSSVDSTYVDENDALNTSIVSRERVNTFKDQSRNLPVSQTTTKMSSNLSTYISGNTESIEVEDMSHHSGVTIDTVSSLNTMYTEKSGLASPRRSKKSSLRKKLNTSTDSEDQLHPPMFVQSRVKKLKGSVTANDTADMVNARENVPKQHNFDVIDAKVNKDYGDIPTISSMAKRGDRSAIRAKSLGGGFSDDRSVSSLRIRRLRNLRMSRTNTHEESDNIEKRDEQKKTSAPRDDSDIPMDTDCKSETSDTPENESNYVEEILESETVVSVGIKEILVVNTSTSDNTQSNVKESVDIATPALEEEKQEESKADDSDDIIDTDLNETMLRKEEDEEEDDQSIRSGQTLGTLRTCFTCKPSSPEEMDKMISEKTGRISKLHHVLTCTHPLPVDADDDSYVPCPVMKHCHAMGVLIRHVQTCTNAEFDTYCEVPGCSSYKKVWNHYRRCISRTFTQENPKECKICHSIWSKYSNNNINITAIEESKV
ncbi:predicted protein [Chaetoceros tenuissimus]|uniref:TAZ-type domain-containing protein n=1 Tax=Chaetoceros tenuissimus TaxID=426638 RepID=A0AAD3DAP8_9STRA|nr:predicted protein [Chaetoceros tenuissimus]